MVRPWKAFWAAMIRVRPVRRVSFTAASRASAPELAKNTPEPAGARHTSRSFSASSTCGSEVKKLEMWTTWLACLVIASTSAGWPWPRVLTAMPPSRSR